MKASSPHRLPLPRTSPARIALFRWYLHYLFWRRFSAVRLSAAGVPNRHEGRPLIIYSNHPGWWDPALIMLVLPKLFPGRLGFAPMEAAQLRRYALFQRFGAFGVEPGPRGAATFLRTARAGLADPAAMLCITAEGAFTDPRTRPIVLRPGLAHLARHVPNAVFLPLALEYVFWNESRPEALLCFGTPVHLAEGTPAQMTASLAACLAATMDRLAADSATRDPSRFITTLHGTAGTGLIYDSWRRLHAWRRGQPFNARHQA